MAQYIVTDILGNTYNWEGAELGDTGPIFTFSDESADSDVIMLRCEGDVFVNIAHVLSYRPASSTA